MSGAESVAGLALGVVALASLFTTCIDIFDYYELSRDYVSDYDTACVKYTLLRERLRVWGSTLQITGPNKEGIVILDRWQGNRDAIARSLLGLQRTLEESEALLTKSAPKSRRENTPLVGGRVKPARRSLNICRRSVWAVNGSKKVAALIDDLAFFIDNLEKVVDTVKMSSLLKKSVGRKEKTHLAPTLSSKTDNKANLSGHLEKALVVASYTRVDDSDSDSNAEETTASSQERERPYEKNAKRTSSPTGQRTMYIYAGAQKFGDDSFILQGPVGRDHASSRYVYKGEQSTSERAIVVHGTMPAETWQKTLEYLRASKAGGQTTATS